MKAERIKTDINNLNVGNLVIEIKDNTEHRILNKTSNSVELEHLPKSKKGIKCSQWYDMDLFDREFKIK